MPLLLLPLRWKSRSKKILRLTSNKFLRRRRILQGLNQWHTENRRYEERFQKPHLDAKRALRSELKWRTFKTGNAPRDIHVRYKWFVGRKAQILWKLFNFLLFSQITCQHRPTEYNLNVEDRARPTSRIYSSPTTMYIRKHAKLIYISPRTRRVCAAGENFLALMRAIVR